MTRACVSLVLAACLLANALSAPSEGYRWRRGDNDIDSKEDSYVKSVSTTTYSSISTTEEFDDDDEDFSDSSTSAPSGSNIFSLLRLAGALLPNLSASNQQKIMSNPMVQNIVREFMKLEKYMKLNKKPVIQTRRDVVKDNEIIIDDIVGLKPPSFFQRQEIEESHEDSSESNDDDDDDDDDDNDSDENNGAEEDSSEDDGNKSDEDDNDKQDSNDSDDDDSDEPPESDGQGGGILGLLAGLSGGEDGQSDLGSLLAAVSGIVANLSGDGFDLNALIASGLGLFVGLLSEGEENPGEILASYLLTSLETITGGGANNNGAFFGKFLSKLITGTSAAAESEDSNSDENGNKMPMKDSAGFYGSLLMGLLGDMSKTSSAGSSKPWRRGDDPWQIMFK
ncbi:serine-aspartate repeat-containing protein F-like [Plodia interpunctella]|uniref:serine-aspartate repeat-containing protein F-like n=1 Tax=Plodia interpunctella TaxID=58824 RepID=UPI002367B92A|nr:serine-aspartate repeat-containing protein F-like [Plodia interpunctella]XP_053617103.1 serine-aspartate repeat-containing protein F-like [Plodia interpunctella]